MNRCELEREINRKMGIEPYRIKICIFASSLVSSSVKGGKFFLFVNFIKFIKITFY